MPRPNTRGVWRIRNSYANARRSWGFAILSKILSTPQEENSVNVLLDRNRPANQIAHLTMNNQSKSDVTALFTYCRLNTPIDQWESAYYPYYFVCLNRLCTTINSLSNSIITGVQSKTQLNKLTKPKQNKQVWAMSCQLTCIVADN